MASCETWYVGSLLKKILVCSQWEAYVRLLLNLALPSTCCQSYLSCNNWYVLPFSIRIFTGFKQINKSSGIFRLQTICFTAFNFVHFVFPYWFNPYRLQFRLPPFVHPWNICRRESCKYQMLLYLVDSALTQSFIRKINEAFIIT